MKNFIRLPLEGTYNTRDLGGYAALNGKITHFHRFLRSDDMHDLTQNDMDFLKEEYHLKTVIDLRTSTEVEARSNPYEKIRDVDYHHISLMNSTYDDNSNPYKMAFNAMMIAYIDILKHEQVALKKVLDTILFAKEGAILYHCVAGKDRTGVISMLLLGICDVAPQDIVTNYEITFANLMTNPAIKEMSSKFPEHILYSHHSYMQGTLDFLYETYGSFEEYFKQLGYKEKHIQSFQNMLIRD